MNMDAFIEWLTKLDQRKHAHLFELEAETFLTTPLIDWPSKLAELVETAAFNAGNGDGKLIVDDFLRQLASNHKDIARPYKNSLLQRDPRYKMCFDAAGISPNNEQFALAQYLGVQAIKNPGSRWICQLAPGKGKSRVAAVTGLVIHLLHDFEHTVHFIHPTTYLMERDRATFKRYWQL